MSLIERLIAPTKEYISFPDLLIGLSSTNNEPLWDVVYYLTCCDLELLNVYQININHKVELAPFPTQELIHYFLENVSVGISCADKEWVFTGSIDNLELLPIESAKELTDLFDAHVDYHFKKSDLLSFAPLDGYLGFLEPETVSEGITGPQGNNSLASYMAEYTLPQVVAMILHIDLADITTTANNSYIHNQNNYDESDHHKFANLLQSYSVAALNNKLAGVDLYTRTVTPYLGDTETYVDLEKTSISRGNLDTYLASIGYELDDLIAQQFSIHPRCLPFDSPQQQDSEQVLILQQQVADLQKELIAVEGVQTSSVIENTTPRIELGKYQKLLISYPLLTAHHIACLISNHNPVGENPHNNDDYKLYKEMVDTAIDARLLTVFNDKGQIPSGEVKGWLARFNFIYEGFNDDLVEYLDDEDDPLDRIRDEVMGVVSVVFDDNKEKDKEIEQLVEDYEELRLEYEKACEDLKKYKHGNSEDLSQQWEAEVNKLKNQLKKINDHRTEVPTRDHVLEFDWYNLDRAVYPPELHLALVLWQQMYQNNKIQNTHHNSHNSRFEVVAKSLGLNPKGSLGNRLNTVTNPVRSKMGQYALAKQLWDIKILNVPVLLLKEPK